MHLAPSESPPPNGGEHKRGFTRPLGALLAALLLTPHPGAADGKPRCNGDVAGFKLYNLPEHSGLYDKGLMCNYTMQSDKGQSSGMAITIEFECPEQIKQAFDSKTGSRKKYDRGANVTRGWVSQDASSMRLREDRAGMGYAGPFTVQEKMFVLVDAQTIATIVVNTDVKPPEGENAQPDPDKLVFSADQAVGLAKNLAFMHSDAKSNLKCATAPGGAGGGGGGGEEKPPEVTLDAKLELTTASARPEIPFGETVTFTVKVSGKTKGKGEAVAKDKFAPLDVELRRDDQLVEKRTTDSEGTVTFNYSPPADTPEKECKKYRFKAVAAKEGVGSAEDTLDAEIQRGECERVILRITRDEIEVPHEDPTIVFTPPKDRPARFRVEARLDPERMVKQYRFKLGGPLAQFAKIEHATATATPGEYEVLDTQRADVMLVVAPRSPEMEALLNVEGGIRLDVEASPRE